MNFEQEYIELDKSELEQPQSEWWFWIVVIICSGLSGLIACGFGALIIFNL